MNAFTRKVEKLEDRVGIAYAKLKQAITAKWPVGSTVQFRHSRFQKRPSTGVVLDHGGARVYIQGTSLNRRGYHTTHRIHWRDVYQ